MNMSQLQNISDDINPIIISANTALDGYKLKNFYITNAFQGFVWMIFHFSVVFFFTFQLQSIFLVGIFLGIANLIAFFLDIPLGILQRYYSTKKLFTIGAISQLIAVAIFFNFIYGTFAHIGNIGKIIVPEGFESAVRWFFSDALNWILVLIASFCYGLTKEINDISTFGYILSHAHPSEYGKILARNNITYWIGSLLGLILSGFILGVNPTFAILFLSITITGFLAFTLRFFDNSHETISLQDITSFTIWIRRLNSENVREYISEKISTIDLPKIIEKAQYIFMKPRQKEENVLKWWVLFSETKQTARIIVSIMGHMPIHIIIYWTISLVLIFWFWDTFATTFLISFLDDLKHGWSYIFLAMIAIPGICLQEFANRLSEKLWVKTIAFFGLILSWTSLILMWIISIIYHDGFGSIQWISIVLILAVINSIWYACGMSQGQNQFLYAYNTIYAKTMWLTEIDPNASAGPIKILQNAANVIGLVCGWFLLETFWYGGFFLFFGGIILAVFGWSYSRRKDILL